MRFQVVAAEHLSQLSKSQFLSFFIPYDSQGSYSGILKYYL